MDVRRNKIRRGGNEIMKDRDLKRNASGAYDPTAYHAVKNLEDEHELVMRLIGCLNRVCELSGFYIKGRITLVNKETGRVWD